MRLIDIKNLSFEYFRRDTEGNVEAIIDALKDVSFDVKPGEFVAIVGRNGSGKSTLAKHINALLLPSEGYLIVDGMDTSEEELRLKIRKTAGMVFQNPDNQIVSNLVEEDVAFGPENLGVKTADIWNRVEYGLETVGMGKYRGSSPNHLSGGQKQRVAIAGVLAMQPKCIIFDEATSMLDPQTREQLVFVAKQLQQEKGITILFITHHMDEVIWADKVIVMNDGAVMAQGTPKQIFGKKTLLEKCGLQLPVLYHYIDFLITNGIISYEEAGDIYDVTDLNALLCHKVVKKKTMDIDGMSKDNDIEMEYQQRRLKGNDIVYRNVQTEDSGSVTQSKMDELDSEKFAFQGILLNQVTHIYNKGFASEAIGLNQIDLQIGKREFVAVIGATGSGKSTLIQHLNGLYLPTEGNVYFDGQDIMDKDFSMKSLRQKVGFVFQNPEYQLFAETVEKDVCFGPLNMNISKIEAQKRAYEAIKAVGLPDTIYDISPLQLSGGQKRRVAIAGVLAMKPEYMVLDEPTAGLDPIAARELLDMLKNLQKEKGITIVMVSHDMEEVAEYADRVIVMHNGKKQMDGPTGEVFQHVADMERMGLSVPLGVKILYALRKNGMDVDLTRCRQNEICNEIMRQVIN